MSLADDENPEEKQAIADKEQANGEDKNKYLPEETEAKNNKSEVLPDTQIDDITVKSKCDTDDAVIKETHPTSET